MKKTIFSILTITTLILGIFALSGCAAKAEGSEPSTSTESGTISSQQLTSYPEKPIEIIVPFAAGGNQDVASRIIGSALEEILGEAIVVTNKEGGGSVIGQTYAFQQEADGYTLLAYSSVYSTNVISQDVTYDINSFIPVAMYANEPEYIVVPADSELNSIEDFINAGKEQTLIIATSGHTTADHIAAEMLVDKTGVQFEYVHGDGAASIAQAIGGNQVDAAVCNYSTVSSLVEQGKAKLLAIFALERSTFAPDTPTLLESGIDLTYGKWRGFAVKEGTPDDIVQILEEAIHDAVTQENVIESFRANGSDIDYLGSKDFAEMVLSEYESLIPVLERLNIE